MKVDVQTGDSRSLFIFKIPFSHFDIFLKIISSSLKYFSKTFLLCLIDTYTLVVARIFFFNISWVIKVLYFKWFLELNTNEHNDANPVSLISSPIATSAGVLGALSWVQSFSLFPGFLSCRFAVPCPCHFPFPSSPRHLPFLPLSSPPVVPRCCCQ